MKTRNALVLALLLLAVIVTLMTVACGPSPAPKVLKIRVAYPSEVSFGDVPSLMAWDKLADKGYAVLPIFFAAPELSTEAVSRGDAEIGTGATRTTFSAIAKGAKLKLIVDEIANEWSVVAAKSVKECKDLEGKKVAIHSEGAISTMMLKTWVDTKCPGTKPNYLIIPGSPSRASALLAGQIDATPAELADAIAINKQKPGEYNVIANFAKDMPKLKVMTFYTNPDFAKAHPEAIKDFIESLLLVYRDIAANPKLVIENAPKYVPNIDAAVLPDMGKAYMDIAAWDVNGGLSEEAVTYSLETCQKAGSVPSSLKAADTYDLSYLNDVLKKIGRK